MFLIICTLLTCLFVVTPNLGYDVYTGVLRSFGDINSRTSPHFPFLMHILFGLLSLSLCVRVDKIESEDGKLFAMVLVLLYHVAFVGVVSFDQHSNWDMHNFFGGMLAIVSLVICWSLLSWTVPLHQAGMVFYSVAFVVNVFLMPGLYAAGIEDDIVLNSAYTWRYVCLISWFFMFAVYVFV